MRIIGVTGTNSAGKEEVANYLKRLGFTHYSMSGFIAEEVKRHRLPDNRPNRIKVGNDLRAQFGADYIVRTLYARAEKSGADSVIESLRALSEVRAIQAHGGFVLGVDAPVVLRYARARARGGVKDDVTLAEFIAQEQSEMNPDDPTKQDLLGALALADAVVQNDNTLPVLHARVLKVLQKSRA